VRRHDAHRLVRTYIRLPAETQVALLKFSGGLGTWLKREIWRWERCHSEDAVCACTIAAIFVEGCSGEYCCHGTRTMARGQGRGGEGERDGEQGEREEGGDTEERDTDMKRLGREREPALGRESVSECMSVRRSHVSVCVSVPMHRHARVRKRVRVRQSKEARGARGPERGGPLWIWRLNPMSYIVLELRGLAWKWATYNGYSRKQGKRRLNGHCLGIRQWQSLVDIECHFFQGRRFPYRVYRLGYHDCCDWAYSCIYRLLRRAPSLTGNGRAKLFLQQIVCIPWGALFQADSSKTRL
jgi:hypothetical protein